MPGLKWTSWVGAGRSSMNIGTQVLRELWKCPARMAFRSGDCIAGVYDGRLIQAVVPTADSKPSLVSDDQICNVTDADRKLHASVSRG